jgi:receptor expression-enhancing protein 5/6
MVSQLSKYPALNNLEKQTSVPKAYAVLGLGALYFFLIIFNLGGQLLTNIAGFIIPGYYSLAALFTASTADDTQWLTVSGAANSLLVVGLVLTSS